MIFIMRVPVYSGPEQMLTHLSAPSAFFTRNKQKWKEWYSSKPHGKRDRLGKELFTAVFIGKGRERRDTGKVGCELKKTKRGM